MSLRTLITSLAGERGIELDQEELDSLGLSDDDEIKPPVEGDVLAQALPGTASGQAEIFLSEEFAASTAKHEGVEKDDLMWYPIIREGQWAVRPGMTGTKKRVPLKIVGGKSKNQRRQIGLQDLLDAFNEGAVEYVTVPSSHNNAVLENQGFIRKMKIVDGTVKDRKTKEDKKVKVLLGGYDFTEPDTKGKVQRGTVAGRSAGILYDYVDTESGKTYPAVVEHVALTNRPWITGMEPFGRKLAGTSNLSIVALSLSDDGPEDDEYALALADEVDLEDVDFLAVDGATWDHETSPNWLRAQVCQVLDDARAEKVAKMRQETGGNYDPLSYNYPPSYRCIEAKPGSALISDGYGDDSNFWVAPITVNNGVVELSDFDTWTASKKAYVPDDRPPPDDDKLPLGEEATPPPPEVKKTRLQLAQERRRARRASSGQEPTTTPREVVEHMAGESGQQLSADAQAAIQAAEARSQELERKLALSDEKISRLTGTVQTNEVESYVTWLSSDEGLGLSEERGFSGFLVEVRQLMLADDGEPAVQGDHFAQDGGSGELTLSDSLKRVFGALAKSNEGKKKLGELLSQPADGDPEGGEKDTTQTGAAGKPPTGEEESTELSAEEKAAKIAKENPAIGALTGSISTNGGDSA